MIKKLVTWFADYRGSCRKFKRQDGYNWAAGKLLKDGHKALADLYQERDGDAFSQGIEYAIADFKRKGFGDSDLNVPYEKVSVRLSLCKTRGEKLRDLIVKEYPAATVTQLTNGRWDIEFKGEFHIFCYVEETTKGGEFAGYTVVCNSLDDNGVPFRNKREKSLAATIDTAAEIVLRYIKETK